MSISENRLELVDPDLSYRLLHATDEEKRSVVRKVCEYAVIAIGIKHPLIIEAMDALRSSRYGDPQLHEKMENLLHEFDRKQWELSEAYRQNKSSKENYLAAFGQSRICHAVIFALNASPDVAVTESLYEAQAGLSDMKKITEIIDIILKAED